MLIRVTASRQGADWLMRFSLDGVHTVQARTWKNTRAKTAEAVSSMSGRPLSEIEREFDFTDGSLHRAYHRLRTAERSLHLATQDHESALRHAATAFCATASVRDAGSILGFSHAYMARMAKDAA
jgi:hypothetical protein